MSSARWLLIGLVALVFFLTSEGTRSYWKRKRYLKELEETLAELKSINKKLALDIELFRTDPRALEQIARKELGLIHPGDIEYLFVVERSTGRKKKQ